MNEINGEGASEGTGEIYIKSHLFWFILQKAAYREFIPLFHLTKLQPFRQEFSVRRVQTAM